MEYFVLENYSSILLDDLFYWQFCESKCKNIILFFIFDLKVKIEP